MGSEQDRLAALLRQLGAPDPEAWAQSEIAEGIPQLLRFLFLRGAWKAVVRDGNTTWMDSYIARARAAPDAPLSGVGASLERLIAAGAARDDIIEVVRGMQYETLFAIAYLLDDPTPAFDDLGDIPPDLREISWGLWEQSPEGAPLRRVDSLHESALDTDPEGREMRPRQS